MSQGVHTRVRDGHVDRTFSPTIAFNGTTFPGGVTSKTRTPEKYTYRQQETVSEGHEKSRDGKYHTGGPFYSIKRVFEDSPVNVSLVKEDPVSGNFRYSGPAYLGGISGLLGLGLKTISKPPNYRSDSALDKAGATMVSASQPENPEYTFGQGLGEIYHDGISRVPGITTWKSRCERAKSVGDDYLSAQYGWAPLTEEVNDGAHIIHRGTTLAHQYKVGSDGGIHRRFSFPDENDSSESIEFSVSRPLSADSTRFYDDSGPIVRWTKTSWTRKSWFSGQFAHGASTGSRSYASMLAAGDKAKNYLGLNITPSLMWELAPWSWAIDWFTNAGDVINNVSAIANQGLVMRYGYVMEEIIYVVEEGFNRCGLYGATNQPGPKARVVTTTKRRRPANPFGFGLTWEGLSPFQLSIAGALGISRLL